MKYYLIGSYPPPIGGISIFIYRFSKILIKQGMNVKVIEFGKMNKVKKILTLFNFIFNPEKSTYHLNSFNYLIMLALLLRPFKKKITFIDHNARSLKYTGAFGRIIFRLFIKKANECILISKTILDYYKENKIRIPKNIKIKNAFIPPPLEDEKIILDSHINITKKFIKEHSPLIIANAYDIVFHEGIDLYGLDISIELIKRLKNRFKNIGLLFAISQISILEYFNKLQQDIKEDNLTDNIYFLIAGPELWPLFKKADLMIRPTYNDGYGISIAEALSMGCPSIASDVCERPEGTILFKNRDVDDLYNKCVKVLTNKKNQDKLKV